MRLFECVGSLVTSTFFSLSVTKTSRSNSVQLTNCGHVDNLTAVRVSRFKYELLLYSLLQSHRIGITPSAQQHLSNGAEGSTGVVVLLVGGGWYRPEIDVNWGGECKRLQARIEIPRMNRV